MPGVTKPRCPVTPFQGQHVAVAGEDDGLPPPVVGHLVIAQEAKWDAIKKRADAIATLAYPSSCAPAVFIGHHSGCANSVRLQIEAPIAAEQAALVP